MATSIVAFNSDETAQICEIIGIPVGGLGLVTTSFTHIPPVLAQIWSPTYTTGDFTTLMQRIWDQLNGADPSTVNRVRNYLQRWDEIGASNPMVLNTGSAGESGVVVNYPQERENIRQLIGNLIGLVVPQAGYYSEMKRRMQYSTDMQFGGSGDR
jgi:hypothetical protein